LGILSQAVLEEMQERRVMLAQVGQAVAAVKAAVR
jgi:hypothetical protein